MLKYLPLIAPILLKVPKRNPVKIMAGLAAAYTMIGIAGIFFLRGFFIWMDKTFNTEIAFFATGAVMLLCALIVLWVIKAPKPKPKTAVNDHASEDTLLRMLPASIRKDPALQAILNEVDKHPIASTAAAASLGALVASEVHKKD